MQPRRRLGRAQHGSGGPAARARPAGAWGAAGPCGAGGPGGPAGGRAARQQRLPAPPGEAVGARGAAGTLWAGRLRSRCSRMASHTRAMLSASACPGSLPSPARSSVSSPGARACGRRARQALPPRAVNSRLFAQPLTRRSRAARACTAGVQRGPRRAPATLRAHLERAASPAHKEELA